MLFVDSKLLDFSTAAASCVLKVELQAVLANVANVKYLDARWDWDMVNWYHLSVARPTAQRLQQPTVICPTNMYVQQHVFVITFLYLLLSKPPF